MSAGFPSPLDDALLGWGQPSPASCADTKSGPGVTACLLAPKLQGRPPFLTWMHFSDEQRTEFPSLLLWQEGKGVPSKQMSRFLFHCHSHPRSFSSSSGALGSCKAGLLRGLGTARRSAMAESRRCELRAHLKTWVVVFATLPSEPRLVCNPCFSPCPAQTGDPAYLCSGHFQGTTDASCSPSPPAWPCTPAPATTTTTCT